MITAVELRLIGFTQNPAPSDHSFDGWLLERDKLFRIGEFNGEGYLIEGIDFHEPINDPAKLKMLVDILFPGDSDEPMS